MVSSTPCVCQVISIHIRCDTAIQLSRYSGFYGIIVTIQIEKINVLKSVLASQHQLSPYLKADLSLSQPPSLSHSLPLSCILSLSFLPSLPLSLSPLVVSGI